MRRLTEDAFCSFHQCFRQRGMRVNGISEIASRRAHFNRQCGFRNHFSGPRPNDADSENSFLYRIDNDFGNPFRACQRLSSAGCGPREAVYENFFSLRFGFGFRDTHPRQLWISEDHGRDGDVVKFDRFTQQRFGCNFGFTSCLVRQHRLAGDITNRHELRVGGALILIDLQEAFFVKYAGGEMERIALSGDHEGTFIVP